jgi:hypothetical protein
MEFCPICYKQTEKEIWKKENRFKEIRWVFCPNHGYIKDDQRRTALNLKIQAAKKRRIRSAALKKPSALYNKHAFLLSKGLIISVLFIIISICTVLGFFVGVQANRHKDIIYSSHIGSFNKASHAEQSKHSLLQRDISQASFDGTAPSPTYISRTNQLIKD